jgi:hypothetical protein
MQSAPADPRRNLVRRRISTVGSRSRTMPASVRRVLGLAASFAACAALAPQALAQSNPAPVVLLQDGDLVPGVGVVTSIDNLIVNASGEWIVEADTDNANTDIDGVLVKNGVLFLREGQALAAPAGASIDSFDAVTLSATSHSGWNFFLAGTSGTSDDSGLFFDGALVFQEGFLSTAAGFSPNTPYIGFFETKVNASNQILIMASVDDPAIASTVDRALVIATVDNAGTLLSETLLFKEGDVLPGQTGLVTDFGTGPHAFDFNEAGSVLYVADLDSVTTTDGVVYLDGTLLAQEGSPSPVAGRNWLTLSTSLRVALNDSGSYVYTGTLDGSTTTDSVIIRDNALFRQEGDSLPDIAPHTLTSFGTGPVDIDNSGNVLWFGDWNDPDTTRDTGLFLNDTLLVQEGVSEINGVTVLSLPTSQDAFAISPDGRYVIFEATLTGSVNGAFLLDLEGCRSGTTYCTAQTPSLPNCFPDFSTIGLPSASAPSGFQIDFGPVPGQEVGIFIYTTLGPAATPLATSFGFLCIQTGAGFYRIQPAVNSGGTFGVCDGTLGMDFNTFFATQTTNPQLVAGAQVDLQAWYRDPPNPGGANLSNALQFVMCP